MAKKQSIWSASRSKPSASTVSSSTKLLVEQKASELVERVLRPKHIQPPPAPNEFQRNYVVDIYTKWYRHYFYFCAKYCSPGPNAIAPFFETKFARLEYIAVDRFNLAFMRHTEQWWELYFDLPLEQCLAAIENDPFFYP